MKYPRHSIRVGDLLLGDQERDAILSVLNSQRITEGPKVRQFEEAWANFLGTAFCVATSSGSSALLVGLLALKFLRNLKDGQKVITSPLTFIATVNAIKFAGFEPVFVDVDRRTFGIKPDLVGELLQKSPQDIVGVLPVHLMGYPVDLDPLVSLAKEHSLFVLEDAAQAHGSIYKGKKVGSLGDIGIFSFYVAHNIQAGELGALVTNNPSLHQLARRLKAQGRDCSCETCTRGDGYCPLLREGTDYDPRFSFSLIGFNFKTTEFPAALALLQLSRVESILARRCEIVKYLNKELSCYDFLQLPLYSEDVSYLGYPLVIKDSRVISRLELRTGLRSKGVESRPLFGCIPTQQLAYSYLRSEYEGRLPNSEYLGQHGFYIGCHQFIEDPQVIVDAFREALKGK